MTLGVGLKHNCCRGNQLLPWEMKTLKLDAEHVGLQKDDLPNVWDLVGLESRHEWRTEVSNW